MQWFTGRKTNYYDSYIKALKDIEYKLHSMSALTQQHAEYLDSIKKQFENINDIINNINDKSITKQLKKALNGIEFCLEQANNKIPTEVLENQLLQINDSLKKLSERLSIDEISQKLKKIDDNLKDIKTKGNNYYITIDRLDINDPKLDSLSFNLDSIDVKELSGNLTIGTHIGMKPDKSNTKKDSQQK